MTAERLIGNAAIDQQAAIGGQARQLAWRWMTNAAGKAAKNIYVRVPVSGSFAAGCRAQFWTVTPVLDRRQNIDISGLSGAAGSWVAVPGFTEEPLTQNAFHYVTVYHPASDGGSYWFKADFGDPASGSLSGVNVFRNGGTEAQAPDDFTFTGGAFGVDVEIDDAAGPDGEPPTAPTGLNFSSPGGGQIELTWNASTDNVAVTGYDVYANGFLRGQVGGATLTFTDTQPDTLTVTYVVRARDAAGNTSGDSNAVMRPGATLPPAGPATEARSVLAPLQRASYLRMTGDAALMALVTGGVHDQVPEDKTRPFVQLGDAIETPANSHDRFGRDTVVTFVVWTEYEGFAQAAAIVDRLVALFDHQRRAIDVVGHRVCSIRHVQAQPLRDPDPRYRQIPVSFRVLTEQE